MAASKLVYPMTKDQLEQNRRCPYGGGCKDCPCDGDCPYREALRPVIKGLLNRIEGERA